MFESLLSNQWFWLGAAGVLMIALGLIFFRHRLSTASHRKANNKQDEEGWRPTGRIDFAGPNDVDPDVQADFSLQAEDTRTVRTIGGLDRHEIRWRKATLREAKAVVKAYHEHRHSPITPFGQLAVVRPENADNKQAQLRAGSPDSNRNDGGAPANKEEARPIS